MIQKLLAEFVGTLFLVLAVLLCINIGMPGWLAALGIGATLMAVIYVLGSVSGAHFNPAVSLGIFVRGGIAVATMVQYWVAQLLGTAAAAGIATLAYPVSTLSSRLAPDMPHHPHGPMPNAAVAFAGVIALETVWTFLLTIVILEVATRKATAGNTYYGAAIGGVVTLGAIVVGPYSGGAFNPAVGSTALLNPHPADIIPYLIGPLLGGLLAGLAFRVFRPADLAD